MSLPVGFRLMPTDDELIGYYLSKKDAGTLPLADENYVRECDLYGNQEPWQIWEEYGGNSSSDLYFFTKLKKKSVKKNPSKAGNASRTVGNNGGHWHMENKSDTFFVFCKETGNDVEVEEKRFKYKPKKKSSDDKESGWLLEEYSVESFKSGWVVCRLRHKSSSKGKRRRADKNGNENSDDNKRRRVDKEKAAYEDCRIIANVDLAVAGKKMQMEGVVSDCENPTHVDEMLEPVNMLNGVDDTTVAGNRIEDFGPVGDWDCLDVDDILNILDDPKSDIINEVDLYG